MPYTKSFKKLLRNVRRQYLGKPVKKKYANRYGKKYDEEEILGVGISIAKARKMKYHKNR